MSIAHVTVEQAFDILADAAGVRHPNPERSNRGLCPAHMDSHNPGLVFMIADSGKLVAHCFAQHCTIDDIADAIGVPVGAFFPDGSAARLRAPATFTEMTLLELLKLLPLGMSFEQITRSVFRVLEAAFVGGIMEDGTLDIERPMRDLDNNALDAYLWLWAEEVVEPERHDWREVSDSLLSMLRQLNRNTRRHTLSSGDAIPRRQP